MATAWRCGPLSTHYIFCENDLSFLSPWSEEILEVVDWLNSNIGAAKTECELTFSCLVKKERVWTDGSKEEGCLSECTVYKE